MGTNYYAKFNICDNCNRFDELHIGKSSVGWTFGFQAHEDKITIKSYKEWLKFLSNSKTLIYDEYGNFVKLEKFMQVIINKKQEKHNHAKEYPDGCFLDKEGNSFHWGEFS